MKQKVQEVQNEQKQENPSPGHQYSGRRGGEDWYRWGQLGTKEISDGATLSLKV